MIWNCVFIK